MTCLWKAPRKSLFSDLTNILRKMTSQPWAKDKITAVSTEIIHGAYLSLKRDPPRPFSWETAPVSADAWCWLTRSILNVSKSREKWETGGWRWEKDGSDVLYAAKVTIISRKWGSVITWWSVRDVSITLWSSSDRNRGQCWWEDGDNTEKVSRVKGTVDP